MIDVDIPDHVQWRVATRRHDWLDGVYLRRLFDRWTGLGLIGRPDRFEAGDRDRKWTLAKGESLADAILRIPRNRGNGISCRMRGTEPQAWWMSVVLMPFHEETGRVSGYSIINLNVPRPLCERLASTLLHAFEVLHGAEPCEYASIHPERAAVELIANAFVPALDVQPMFAGVLWANFVGAETIQAFSREVIDGLAVARRRWFDDGGVLLVASEALASIDSPPAQAKLIAMTNALRSGQL